MSTFAPELDSVHYRFVVIAPSIKEALGICEKISFEFTTDLVTPTQKIDMVNYAPAKLSVCGFVSWTSLSLGRRAENIVRAHVISFALENGLPSKNLLDMADAFILYNPKSDELSERFLKLQFSVDQIIKPIIFLNPESSENEIVRFRQNALSLWANRNFKFLLNLPNEDRFFEKSLDWTLMST